MKDSEAQTKNWLVRPGVELLATLVMHMGFFGLFCTPLHDSTTFFY